MAKSLLDWFRRKSRLVEVLKAQALVQEEDLAKAIAHDIKLEEIPGGKVLIEQGAADSDLFLILSGEFAVAIDGREVARLGAGQHVGEMAAITDSRRSATVTANRSSVVARIGKDEFSALASRFPGIWQRVAAELGKRLHQSHP